MKKFLASVLLGFFSLANAQTAQTTPNLITSGTTHTWSGVTTGAIPAGCATAGPCPGGPGPIYDPATNTISFSYNANAYVGQVIAINNALANVGAGVKISGYNYGYEVRNMNGDDRQGGIDTFTVATALRGANNSVLLSTNQYFNTKFDWTAYSGTKNAATPIAMADATYLQIGITGGDNGYWGGYFGPQVRNVNMSLNYTVDPCATNPAYSPTCANYNTVNVSGNLVPNPNGYAQYGNSINQSYAINQALQLSGSGVMIHGFQWGYVANANGPYCSFWDIFGCWGQVITPSVSTNVNITDNNGASLYSVDRTYTNSYNTTNYKYLFPSSRNLATLGNFNFTAKTNDVAYVGDMWSKALYTPDPCVVNPLSSTSCAGYQQAYTEQQCASNPLYSTQCVGYAAAYQIQQCTANPLYSPSCAGYASAYLNYQCSINPLYATTCQGYEQAYLDQQCGISPLYSQSCSGYSRAYHDQQCSINPLYATDCVGYIEAYTTQQCSISPLYSPTCRGYAVAYHDQQCSMNPLYMSDCVGYHQAYLTQQCSINPLYSTQCSGYAAAYKSQQCSLNPLYDPTCSGYAAAYKTQQCSANQLYATDCPNYAVAYHDQQCSLNPLYMSDCAGYTKAYHDQQCSISPLYAADCIGYAAAFKNQQCTANPLYATDCPGYEQALLNANCIKDSLYSKLCTGYATAYAIKYLVVVDNSSVVNQALSNNAAAMAAPPVPPPVASPVEMATTAPSTTSMTSVNSVVAPPPAPAGSPMSPAAQSAPPPPPPAGGAQEPPKPSGPPSARQALAERRQEAAKAEAVAKGKDLAKTAGGAKSMADQVAAQGLIAAAMGYNPNFDAYKGATIPDATAFYRPYTVYGGQKNVENRNTLRMFGGSDAKHQTMVDSQYNLGK